MEASEADQAAQPLLQNSSSEDLASQGSNTDLAALGEGNRGKPPPENGNNFVGESGVGVTGLSGEEVSEGETSRRRKAKRRRARRPLRSDEDEDEDLISLVRRRASTFSLSGTLLALFVWFKRMIYMLASETWVSLRYVTADSKRNKRNFFVAVVTIVIVVTFVVSLSTSITKSSLVFIKLAENTVGEYDVVMTPSTTPITMRPKGFEEEYSAGPQTETFLLNSTAMHNRLKNAKLVAGVAPRWTMLGRVGNRFDPSRNASTIILIIDTEQEKKIGLGRTWEYGTLDERQAVISGPLLRNIGVKAGETCDLTIDLVNLASNFGMGPESITDALKEAFIYGLRMLAMNRTVKIDPQTFDLSLTLAIAQFEAATNITIPPLAKMMIESQIDKLFNGSTTPIEVNLEQLLSVPLLESIFKTYFSPQVMQNLLTFRSEVEVKGSVEEPRGKWPSALGSVVVMEARYIPFLLFKDWLPAPINQNAQLLRSVLRRIPGYIYQPSDETKTVDQLLIKFPVNDYALMVIAQNKDRLATYMSERRERDARTRKWTDELMGSIGLDIPATITMPINQFMKGADIAQAFLSQILIGMLVVLGLHSMLVIYSLLLSNTEEKTYEYGMLRALGMKHSSLIHLLTIQALFFSLPAIAIGYLFAWLINIPTSYFIAWYSATDMDWTLTGWSLLIGAALGILMPIVANIIPIRRALSQTLRDALDVYHQRFSETVITIVRLESLGVSVEQTVMSLLMIVFGFGLIYVVPLTFRFQYWGLFLGLLNATLLGMVIGLAMIASVVQQRIEGFMLHLMMFGRLRKLKGLVRKSLSAHGDRNRKTALMFTTVVAFVIFAASAFHFQSTSVTDSIRVLSGSDIVFQSFSLGHPLDEERMTAFLKQQMARKNSRVLSYSYATFSLTSEDGISGTYISNMDGQPYPRTRIYGVDENYMDTMYDEFFVSTDIDDSFKYSRTKDHKQPDVIRSLYTDAGKATVPFEKTKNGKRYIPPVLGTGYVATPYNKRTPNETYIDTNKFPTLFAHKGQLSVPYLLYRDENSTYSDYIDVIASTAMNGVQLYINNPLQFRVRFQITNDHSSRLQYMGKPRAFVSKMPGFLFSWMEILARAGQPLLVSMDTYARLTTDIYYARLNASKVSGLAVPDRFLQYTPIPRKAKLLVNMHADATRDEREFVVNGLKNFVKYSNILVSDTTELIGSTQFAVSLLSLFFYVVSVIAMVLCFFVLWISFNSNVRENSWEFGVLRAIGLSSWEVISVYIFEALAIILTSVVLATIIGCMVALTLTLQYSLFNDMPVDLFFPYTMFAFLFLVSVGVSLLGSYLPARSLSKHQIASTIRGK
eukprot:TRINITY_DN3089_c0_g1_i1.p1 TRINITY_DN3089_c0_g1~~TRINITY_DN3089_c0_g1_i1.p1  ORF type:complete len:1336 (+),score=202.48 TRINITY_DN3089_c0_g1_i1:44-4051(+)